MNEIWGVMSEAGDGTAGVSFRRHLDTDAADLWTAVTSPERLARWFAPVEGELRVDGEFVIHFDDEDTPTCRVIACDEPRSFAWEWTHEVGSSLVRVEVAPDGAGSQLLLEHTRLSRSSASGYAGGWHAYLPALEQHLAGREGGDLWPEWPRLRDEYAALLG